MKHTSRPRIAIRSALTLRRVCACLCLAAGAMLLCDSAAAPAADDLDALEAAAFSAAVDRVASSVVRIETIGGLERIGRVLLGAGPTTGLIVDPEGYIVSSAFNFVGQPSSILVRLPDGTRKPATLVATDKSRMLVVLKIDVDKPLPVCPIAPEAEIRVGQWAIAVGRAFDNAHPNLTVGVISAVNRIWGKAIQTDAAVSPNNYGGPLIDIYGRVLGVLVPLSPQAADTVTGVEWYDSGIGFAIPAEHIQQVLPRLKKGETLRPGLAGVSLKGPNLYTSPPRITACRSKSPAAAAGIKAGDRVVEIDGRQVQRAAQINEAIGRHYAGDTLHVVVLRDNVRHACDVTLAAELAPYQHGFLGILPIRDRAEPGVAVRYVYPDSPAAQAGITPGDVVLAVDGQPLADRNELWAIVGTHEPGDKVELELRHGDAARKTKVALAALPENLPPTDLPAARGKAEPSADAKSLATGAMPWKAPEFANEAWAYVPRSCEAQVAQGVVVWLHGEEGYVWKKLLAQWKPLCDRYDLILLAPKAADAQQWMPGDIALINRLLGRAVTTFPVDPARIVVCGQGSGGAAAFLAAFHNREAFRAVAAVDAAAPQTIPENEPPYRLAVYLATAGQSRDADAISASLKTLRKQKIPVTIHHLGETPRTLSADELAELARWIDALDRI